MSRKEQNPNNPYGLHGPSPEEAAALNKGDYTPSRLQRLAFSRMAKGATASIAAVLGFGAADQIVDAVKNSPAPVHRSIDWALGTGVAHADGPGNPNYIPDGQEPNPAGPPVVGPPINNPHGEPLPLPPAPTIPHPTGPTGGGGDSGGGHDGVRFAIKVRVDRDNNGRLDLWEQEGVSGVTVRFKSLKNLDTDTRVTTGAGGVFSARVDGGPHEACIEETPGWRVTTAKCVRKFLKGFDWVRGPWHAPWPGHPTHPWPGHPWHGQPDGVLPRGHPALQEGDPNTFLFGVAPVKVEIAPTPAPVDVCPNIEGAQTVVLPPLIKDQWGNCVPPPPPPTPEPVVKVIKEAPPVVVVAPAPAIKAPIVEKPPVEVGPPLQPQPPKVCPDGTVLPDVFQGDGPGSLTEQQLEEIKCEILKAEKDREKQLEMLGLLRKSQIHQLELLLGRDLDGDRIIGPDLDKDGKADGPSVPETVKESENRITDRLKQLMGEVGKGGHDIWDRVGTGGAAVAGVAGLALIGIAAEARRRLRRRFQIIDQLFTQVDGRFNQLSTNLEERANRLEQMIAGLQPRPSELPPTPPRSGEGEAGAGTGLGVVTGGGQEVEPESKFSNEQIATLATAFESLDRMFMTIDSMTDNELQEKITAAKFTEEQAATFQNSLIQAILILSEEDDEDELKKFSLVSLIRRLLARRGAINPNDASRIDQARRQFRAGQAQA